MIKKTLKPKRILLLFSGTQNDANVITSLAHRYKGTLVDLLYVRGINSHDAKGFPSDIMYEIISTAPNIINCYICNAATIGEYLKENADRSIRFWECQCCQIALYFILACFIKRYGYDQIVHLGPLFDERLGKVPASMILDDPVFSRWEYPLPDYRIISKKVNPYCVRDSSLGWNNDTTMSEEKIRQLCQDIIDRKLPDRLSMKEVVIKYYPFSW